MYETFEIFEFRNLKPYAILIYWKIFVLSENIRFHAIEIAGKMRIENRRKPNSQQLTHK